MIKYSELKPINELPNKLQDCECCGEKGRIVGIHEGMKIRLKCIEFFQTYSDFNVGLELLLSSKESASKKIIYDSFMAMALDRIFEKTKTDRDPCELQEKNEMAREACSELYKKLKSKKCYKDNNPKNYERFKPGVITNPMNKKRAGWVRKWEEDGSFMEINPNNKSIERIDLIDWFHSRLEGLVDNLVDKYHEHKKIFLLKEIPPLNLQIEHSYVRDEIKGAAEELTAEIYIPLCQTSKAEERCKRNLEIFRLYAEHYDTMPHDHMFKLISNKFDLSKKMVGKIIGQIKDQIKCTYAESDF